MYKRWQADITLLEPLHVYQLPYFKGIYSPAWMVKENNGSPPSFSSEFDASRCHNCLVRRSDAKSLQNLVKKLFFSIWKCERYSHSRDNNIKGLKPILTPTCGHVHKYSRLKMVLRVLIVRFVSSAVADELFLGEPTSLSLFLPQEENGHVWKGQYLVLLHTEKPSRKEARYQHDTFLCLLTCLRYAYSQYFWQHDSKQVEKLQIPCPL